MPNFKWNQIESLILEAQEQGQVSLEFNTIREANLFRFSFYNFRRKKNLKKDLSISLTDNIVTIYRPVEIYIRKLEPKEIPEGVSK